jgi:hypothetical protein
MNSFILILLSFVLAINIVEAQNIFAVQNGNNPMFYSNLDTAIIKAQSGDTIFLPGGSYSIKTPIDKELHIIGTGFFPDSTLATSPSHISGNMIILSGSDNGSLTGFSLIGDIVFGTNTDNQNVNNFLIDRCSFNTLKLSFNGSDSTSSTNFLVKECVIKGNVYGGYLQNIKICNCIIGERMCYFNGYASFQNNIFLLNNSILINTSSARLINNIFLSQYSFSIRSNGNIFNNNLLVYGGPPFNNDCYDNIVYNNIFGIPKDSIFVNQVLDTYNPINDYHLKPTCRGKNAGHDGTDVGIYGGSFPWKEGSVPFNPHFQKVKISSQTDINGNLNVNIKVAAQDH